MAARFGALLLMVLPAFGQESKILDLSTATGKKAHYVVFAARGGSATGHAFVVWGIEDGESRRSSIRALGLYPEASANNCSSVVRTVPGRVMDEMLNHSVQSITEELIVQVDEADYRRSWKMARAWDCKNEFSLLSRDCVQFLRAVGGSLHLNMPSRTIARWTPQAYVRTLIASVTKGRVEMAGAVYSGSLMDRQPMGHGELTFPDGSNIGGTFWGWDHHAGNGSLIGIAGHYRYEGGIVDYRAQGRGTLSRGEDERAEAVITGRFDAGMPQSATARKAGWTEMIAVSKPLK